MEIVDLAPAHEPLYFVCLEDWSEEMQEAGDHKEVWYERMKGSGLRVKLALDDTGRVGGMIQYLPIEQSFAEGSDLHLIMCIWVHGHKQGPGNLQKRGMGKALLHAAEDDAKALGSRGMAAWGLWIPVWMKASWFRKQGYKKADRDGIRVLVWKPFRDDAAPPKWIRRKKTPEGVPGKVTVTAFINGWCAAQSITVERAKRAAACFGDEVQFRQINTSDREVLLEWGISDALFVDDREVSTGPPPTFEKIRRQIAKRVRRL